AEEARGIYPEDFTVMALLGRSYTANDKKDRARAVYRTMTKLASYDSRQLHKIARLQFEASDIDSGIWSLRKAVEGDETFVLARQALIESLISTGDLAGAREHLKKLGKTSDKDVYYRLDGDWQLKSKNFTKAAASYRISLNQKPDSNVVIKLFDALVADKKIDRAVSELISWMKKYPDSIPIKMALAGAYLRTGNLKKAAKLYETVLEENSKNSLALNNLANIYYENKDKRALSLARRAQEITPDHPDFNDTLGWLLVDSDKPEEGLPYLRNAFARASDNPEIRYHIAVALNKLGRNDEAVSELNSALSYKQGFASRQAAETLFKQIGRR
ncbi:MAG: tetratricopeptide repeat protein, partial [Gammaproteobacteria bacterium]|nr:tetratricopeptide repeat protein [Gammaproteobacteria bacterium]